MTNQERMEQIELPEELEQVILKAVSLGRKKKNRMMWRRAGFSCVGAAAAMAVLISAGFISPIAAQAFEGLPAVGKVFTYLYDLAGYEGRYTQVAEDARPAVPAERKEADRGGFQQEGISEDQQTAVGQQGTSDQQGPIDSQDMPGQKDTEEEQNAVLASDAGITIAVKEYFCDKQSLYLSMLIESEKPFFEGEVEVNKRGYIQLFTGDETLSYEGNDAFSVGNGGLLAEGVYLDDHTFAGIARSEWRSVREENIAVPDELTYKVSIKHLKIFTEDGTPDFRGEWVFSMEIFCEKDSVRVLAVEATGDEGSSICEVRLQPYEIKVVTESGNGIATLTEEEKMLVAFDEDGNLLDSAGSTLSYREGGYEIYEYTRPENLEGLELFIVEEGSWMNQWKGKLYDGTMTGSEMVRFLMENCIVYATVDCSR